MRQIPIFARRRGDKMNKLSPITPIVNLIHHMFDSVGEGIVAHEVKRAGHMPVMCNLSDRLTMQNTKGDAALISINDPITLGMVVQQWPVLKKNFRSVVVGGQIPSLMPDVVGSVLPEANIFMGECEDSMNMVLNDAVFGKRRMLYSVPPVDIAKNYVRPLRQSSERLTHAVELGRGCSYGCNYCGMPKNFRQVRIRDPADVIDEIDSLKGALSFVDSNISGYPPEYLHKIFTHLERTGRIWVGEGTARELLGNPDLWDLMSRTCVAFLTGIEDPTVEALNGRRKSPELLQPKNGSVIFNTMIAGHPAQGPAEREAFLGYSRAHNLTAFFTLYTPFPGTAAFRDADSKGLILQRNFALYDRRKVVVKTDMGPVETKEFLMKAQRSAHTIAGTIKEVIRIVRESSTIRLALARLSAMLVVRMKALLAGHDLWKWRNESADAVSIPIPEQEQ
ncbi:MAG: hypothetical protein V1492_05565 [Candidatus Micrarchaeota archaeon]